MFAPELLIGHVMQMEMGVMSKAKSRDFSTMCCLFFQAKEQGKAEVEELLSKLEKV